MIDQPRIISVPTMRLRWNHATGKLQQQWFIAPAGETSSGFEWRDVEIYFGDDATVPKTDGEP
jgi:hypothetical protein